MAVDKASRLAAIRAANALKKAAPVEASAPDAPVVQACAAVPVWPGTPKPKAPAAASPHSSNPLLVWGLRVLVALLFVVVGGLLVVAMFVIWQPILHAVLPDVGSFIAARWQPTLRDELPALAANTPLSLSRASAMVSYVLLWLSLAVGLAMSGRVVRVWPGVSVSNSLHQHLSLLGLLFAVFHVLVLLADPALDFTLAKAFLPFFGSSYRPMWVGILGKAALYLMALVWGSFYLRKRIGGRWWRRLHYLSFAVYLLTVLHGVFAGTDTGALWAQALYALSGASLLALTVYRIASTRRLAASDVGHLQVGAVTLDPITRTVTLAHARNVALQTIEARLLYYLMQNEGQVIVINQIIAKVWGQHYLGNPHLVAFYIRRLRTKIEPNPAQPVYIRSVNDQSYAFHGHVPLAS